jgi:hypothetical protein
MPIYAVTVTRERSGVVKTLEDAVVRIRASSSAEARVYVDEAIEEDADDVCGIPYVVQDRHEEADFSDETVVEIDSVVELKDDDPLEDGILIDLTENEP